MTVVSRLMRWLGSTGTITARGLRNVGIAILLVPVLPDIAVEAFGDDEPGWLNPLLRLAALVVIVVAVVTFNRLQVLLAKRRAASTVLHRMRRYDVVVLPLSPSSTYRETARRPGDPSVPEVIVDQAGPTLVVGVPTGQVPEDQIDTMRAALRIDGIELEVLPPLTDPGNAEATVPEATTLLLDLLRRRNVHPSNACFDTTGGTVPMSLAMLHAAARYGSDCCYVSSGSHEGRRLPNTQTVASFDPAALAAGP